jgi:hypothetical protein
MYIWNDTEGSFSSAEIASHVNHYICNNTDSADKYISHFQWPIVGVKTNT